MLYFIRLFFPTKAIVTIASILIFILLLSILCIYDHAGKKFQRLKIFQFKYNNQNENVLTAHQIKQMYNLKFT